MDVNRIICGDALGVLKTLPDNSIDLICTDPPYGLGIAAKGTLSIKGSRQRFALFPKVIGIRLSRPKNTSTKSSALVRTRLSGAAIILPICCHLHRAGFPGGKRMDCLAIHSPIASWLGRRSRNQQWSTTVVSMDSFVTVEKLELHTQHKRQWM
jgi:hypothetical protein